MTDDLDITQDPPPLVDDGPAPSQGEMERRWGKEAVRPGFVYLPSALLRGQARLKINATEMTVLIHLVDHWWRAAEMPFPSKHRLAERMGVSEKTIQRAMARLEAVGLVKRVARHLSAGGQTSNVYDLTGLVGRMREIGKDLTLARETGRAEMRKAERPGLKSRAKSKPAKPDIGE
jgi:predicted transcriptional regulator